jgi:N6-L-threonylcarbamoyladenine synthase
VTVEELDGVPATAGPGLIGGVMVGLTTAKALALGAGKPLVAVNHLMGHALTARLTHGVGFPFLLLLVSGGHCQLVGVGGPEDFRLYGSTIDDAVARLSTRQPRSWACPIRADRRSRRPRRAATPKPMICRVLC